MLLMNGYNIALFHRQNMNLLFIGIRREWVVIFGTARQ